MNACPISPSVYYIGVDERTTDLFESLWPLPVGVSYNSYVVRGAKTAIIDAVEAGHAGAFLEHLAALGIEAPDYLIVNHMEPDHSGALPVLAERFAGLKIVGNKLTVGMIRGFHPDIDPERLVCVTDGDTLDLGNGRILRFVTIPMVHWPETMATYLESEGVLFTGDALGTFGALDGHVLDRDINGIGRYFDEMYRYYACIVAKYADPVQRALQKLAGLSLNAVCPTHGPVWTDCIPQALGQYDRMSRCEAEPGAVVVYGSMYGHTAAMAAQIVRAVEAGGVPAVCHDASRTDLSFILADIWRYGALAVGSATYNGSVMPPVQALLSALEMRGLKNRRTAVFGNYTWASMAVRKIRESLGALGLEPVLPPVDVKMRPTAADMDALTALGEAIR